ncbi:hypothetical protein Pfo_018827 [Paulownia fortunei]|nr:hypothetical protein Pfo_018827 [Paulownia fortunei]
MAEWSVEDSLKKQLNCRGWKLTRGLAGSSSGGGCGRGGGRGHGGARWRKKTVKKSADELDKELENYHAEAMQS